MEVSIFLGKVIAIFMIIMALFMIVKRKSLKAFAQDIWKNEIGLLYMSVINIILGLLLVVAHQVWSADWRIVVTIFGWSVLIKGVCLLFWPERLKKFSKIMNSESYILIGAALWLVIGLYLLMNVL